MATTKKSKTLSDALVMLMPIAVPYAVKKLFALVPRGSRVDEFFEHYKEHWTAVSTVVGDFILGITNLPDLGDDLVAEFSAEVARTIKERYSEGEYLKDITSEKNGVIFPVSIAMATLSKAELVKFVKLLNVLPEDQRKKVLALEMGGKEDTKEYTKTLVSLNEDQFKAWAAIIAPVKKPKVDTEFEKNIKEGVSEFKSDAKNYFQKDSWAVRLAKRKGLM